MGPEEDKDERDLPEDLQDLWDLPRSIIQPGGSPDANGIFDDETIDLAREVGRRIFGDIDEDDTDDE